MVTLYHGTSVRNVESIRKQGLKSFFEGVYLTDTLESATRWTSFRLAAFGEKEVAIVEVEVDEKKLEEGNDHSPLMEAIFGVGKSILSPKSIPPKRIKNIHIQKI